MMPSSPGGHPHPRRVLYEPEAPFALHQEDPEEGGRRGGVQGGRQGAHSQGGLREHEPDRLRPHSGHARRTRGESCLPLNLLCILCCM